MKYLYGAFFILDVNVQEENCQSCSSKSLHPVIGLLWSAGGKKSKICPFISSLMLTNHKTLGRHGGLRVNCSQVVKLTKTDEGVSSWIVLFTPMVIHLFHKVSVVPSTPTRKTLNQKHQTKTKGKTLTTRSSSILKNLMTGTSWTRQRWRRWGRRKKRWRTNHLPRWWGAEAWSPGFLFIQVLESKSLRHCAMFVEQYSSILSDIIIYSLLLVVKIWVWRRVWRRRPRGGSWRLGRSFHVPWPQYHGSLGILMMWCCFFFWLDCVQVVFFHQHVPWPQ